MEWTSNNPAEYNRIVAERYNQRPGNLDAKDGIDCPECLNRGFVWFVNPENGGLYTCGCKCARSRRAINRLAKSGLSSVIDNYTFDTWQTPERWQRQALALARQYAQGCSGWFFVGGRAGSGKTHLCTGICRELILAGHDVRYITWVGFSTRAKAAITDGDAYRALVSPLQTAEILYIDDYFKSFCGSEPTAGDRNLSFNILGARYADPKKMTIISSEHTLNEIMSLDEATGSRIKERSKGYCLDFSGKENWRMK